MNAFCWLLAAALLAFSGRSIRAQDMKVSLRLHADKITYGDPLYLKVTIANRGKKAASVQPPFVTIGTLEFRIRDPERGLTDVPPLAGGCLYGDDLMLFAPNEAVKYYGHLFLPNLGWPMIKGHPFWAPIQKKGRRLEVTAVYHPRPGVALLSEPREVFVEPRAPRKLRFLTQVRELSINISVNMHETYPAVVDFGHRLNRDWIRAIAAEVKPGELKDLLDLTLILKDIHLTPAEARAEENRALLEWLRKQSEIKREILTKEARRVASRFKMRSTVEAIDAAFPPAANTKKTRAEEGTPPPSGLDISVRHTSRLTFGDPLYFEVTITNRGEKAVSGPIPSLARGTLEFRLEDPERHRLTTLMKAATEAADGGETVQFAPGETVKYRGYLLFPDVRRMDDPFWEPFQKDGYTIHVSAVCHWRPRVELTDGKHGVVVQPREPEELAGLKAWRDVKPDKPPKGPTQRDFGVFYPGLFNEEGVVWLSVPGRKRPYSVQQLSGELAYLLSLGRLLKDIHAASGEEREKKIRHLVDWLGEMPDLKRQVLTAKAREVAERYDMRATAEALAAPRPPEPKGNRRDRDPLSSPKILSPNPF